MSPLQLHTITLTLPHQFHKGTHFFSWRCLAHLSQVMSLVQICNQPNSRANTSCAISAGTNGEWVQRPLIKNPANNWCHLWVTELLLLPQSIKRKEKKRKKRIPWFCKRAGANNNKKSNPSKSKSSQNATKESRSTSLRITHKNEWSMRESKPNSGWPMWCQGSKQHTRSKLRWRRDEREQRRFKDQHFSHRQECDDGVKLNGMLQYAYSLRLR